jgi:hypothetical protein
LALEISLVCLLWDVGNEASVFHRFVFVPGNRYAVESKLTPSRSKVKTAAGEADSDVREFARFAGATLL